MRRRALSTPFPTAAASISAPLRGRPVGLDGPAADRYASGKECMEAIREQADEMAVPFREA